jgi:signal transduction histidine kinase
MTTISGFVGGILDGTIPHEKQSDYLKIVLSETKRLSKLINSFLDISRYDEANAPLNKTSFDIVEMLRVVLLSFENTVNERSISIYFEYPQENIFVFADESEIYRVAVNLIDNAVKFVNDGGNIDVLVKLDHNKVFVSIANTGEGISDDDKAYIWDRFYKTDKSRTGEKGGFGLGLYIVRSIIKNHGEDIYLDNSGGKTSFTFTLPVVK